jgi:2-methylcitrate dehydratase PrpD
MVGLTEAIGRFVGETRFAVIPDDVAPIVKSGFIDACGTLVCGRGETPVTLARRYALQNGQGSVAEARLFFGAERMSAEAAAWINGVACHVLDYDDVGLRAHPSTVLVPAILAEAERSGRSGADCIAAYIVGYEVWAELNAREPGAMHLKGWHPTSTVGVVAAAAAVAHLLRLDAERARNAVALAASMSGGVVANFGSMSKSLQVGRAAASGLVAARLAETGMDASRDALESRTGLLSALSPNGAADLASPADQLGKTLRIREMGLSFKMYPVCYCAHRVIDATIGLAQANDLHPADIEAATTTIGETQRSILRNHAPKTGLEAKFSIEFAVASALASRAVSNKQLNDGYVTRDDVQALMRKVAVLGDNSVCPVEPAFSLHDRVVIRTTDGREFDSGPIRFARGHARSPVSADELKAKFVDCCDGAGFDAGTLHGRLAALETISDMRGLAA